MKIMVASDLHGSLYYGKMLVDAFLKEKAETLVLLGDLYYHGPRNPLEREYDPMGLSNLLNEISEKLVVIKGNCDSEVDEMISNFKFLSAQTIKFGNLNIALAHGHLSDINNMPKGEYDMFLHGHTHIGFIDKIDGIFVANPGSVTLPKGGTPRSYLVIDNSEIRLVNLESGEIIVACKT